MTHTQEKRQTREAACDGVQMLRSSGKDFKQHQLYSKSQWNHVQGDQRCDDSVSWNRMFKRTEWKFWQQKGIETKNSVEGLTVCFNLCKKELVNLEISQQRLCSMNNREKRMKEKNESSLREMWDTPEHVSMSVIGVLEGEEAQKRGRKNKQLRK